MKNSRIHLVWGLVAIGLSVGVGSIVAQRKDDALRDRQEDHEKRITRIRSRTRLSTNKP